MSEIKKSFKINLDFNFQERTSQQYANDVEIFKNNHSKTLVCDDTSEKEDILEEVKNHFQNILKEFSQFLKKREITENKTEKETDLSF